MTIEIVEWPHDDEEGRQIIASGKGFCGYVGFVGLRERSQKFGEVDVWYTERNGDPIGLVVPKGTLPDQLPDNAMSYLVFEWIDPDKEFGTGIKKGYKNG